MKELKQLNAKERSAVELRYLGNQYSEIEEKINIPVDTLKRWFKQEGELYYALQEYTEQMNQTRMEKNKKNIAVADEEWFTVTTNAVRQIGRIIQGQRIPMKDKEGNVITDENGEPKYIDLPPEDFHIGDLEKVWKMQRIMQGLPITHEKQDITQRNEEADKIIQDLGLTEEDFNDENLDGTTKKITEYLRNQ